MYDLKVIDWTKIAVLRIVIWEEEAGRQTIREIFECKGEQVLTASGKFRAGLQEFIVNAMAFLVDRNFSMSIDLLDGNNGNRLDIHGNPKED